MMKTIRFITTCLLTLLLLSACVSKSKYIDLENNLASTQEQVNAKNTEIRKLEDKRKELMGQIAEMEKQLEEKEDALRKKDEVIDEMASTRKNIEDSLKDQIASKQVRLETLEGKLKITFVDKILFNSGSAQINQAGQQSLLSLASILSQEPDQRIVVEGHTDDVGVGKSLQSIYPTNWELSTARATAVVRFLQDKAKIKPERLSAVGYSYYKPIAENDTEDGRAQNRRIEIILVPSR
jgi:chemotaxis protein MotB